MGLEIKPEFRGAAEEPGQTEGCVRRDAPFAPDDLADARLVDVRSLRKPISRDSHGLQEIFGEDLSGMDIR